MLFLLIEKFCIYESQSLQHLPLLFMLGWPVNEPLASTWVILEEMLSDKVTCFRLSQPQVRWRVCSTSKSATSRWVKMCRCSQHHLFMMLKCIHLQFQQQFAFVFVTYQISFGVFLSIIFLRKCTDFRLPLQWRAVKTRSNLGLWTSTCPYSPVQIF